VIFNPDQARSRIQFTPTNGRTCQRSFLWALLIKSASGIEYAEASQDISAVSVDGVLIPFASTQLPWRMKAKTHRSKDDSDRLYLRQWFESRDLHPPAA
jgi:hypothetical protein